MAGRDEVRSDIAAMFAELQGYESYEYALACRMPTQAERDRWQRARQTQRLRFRVDENTKHGITAYGNGCRCETCREANTTYMRNYQRARAQDPAFRAKRREYDRKKRERKALARRAA